MELKKKMFFVALIVVGVGALIAIDKADRDIFYSRSISEEEIKEFHNSKTIDEVQEAYERNYENPDYAFPRGNVEEVKIYKNQFLISRITSRTLSNENAMSAIDFFNDPDNFDWGETTWRLSESEYILRFFDSQENEIGTVWLCVGLQNDGINSFFT